MKSPTTKPKIKKQPKGFNVMSTAERTRIARMGGKAVKKKYGRTYLSDLGVIGGKNSHINRKSKKAR
jgi:hypothetical protein